MLVTLSIVFQLLSEVVFDFLKGEMTQQKIKDLKQSLNKKLLDGYVGKWYSRLLFLWVSIHAASTTL